MDSMRQKEAPRLCKPCNALFPTWELLLKHKADKRKAGVAGHVHCKFCGHDFATEQAETLHVQQYHAHEQSLQCPGCGHGPFVRLSGLMSHVESGQCARIDADVLEEVRAKKQEFARKLEALTNKPIKNNYASFVSPDPDARSLVALTPRNDQPSFSFQSDDFPSLSDNTTNNPSQKTASSTSFERSAGDEGVWANKENLFPDPPVVKRPTGEQLGTASAPSARMMYEAMEPDHPNHPSFNSSRYYCKFSEKFECPKIGCRKSFKKAGGLVAHLKSPAHGNLTYRCPTCLGSFKSLTAITMHVESNGTKCRIRDTDNYEAYLDQLTAGMVDIDQKRHDDGTVAYKTASKAREVFRERGKTFDPMTAVPMTAEARGEMDRFENAPKW